MVLWRVAGRHLYRAAHVIERRMRAMAGQWASNGSMLLLLLPALFRLHPPDCWDAQDGEEQMKEPSPCFWAPYSQLEEGARTTRSSSSSSTQCIIERDPAGRAGLCEGQAERSVFRQDGTKASSCPSVFLQAIPHDSFQITHTEQTHTHKQWILSSSSIVN